MKRNSKQKYRQTNANKIHIISNYGMDIITKKNKTNAKRKN